MKTTVSTIPILSTRPLLKRTIGEIEGNIRWTSINAALAGKDGDILQIMAWIDWLPATASAHLRELLRSPGIR